MKLFKEKTEKEIFAELLKKLNKYDTHRKVIKNYAVKEYRKPENKQLLNQIIENAKRIKINNFEFSEFETLQEKPLIKEAQLKLNYNSKLYNEVINHTVTIRIYENKPVLSFINQLVNHSVKLKVGKI